MVPAQQILDLLPSRCSRLLGTNRSGPNCYNATLVYHNAINRVEYVDYPDMERWLDHNTFKLGNNAELIVGDIAVFVSTYDGALSHTAVHIGDGWYFHKPGISGDGWEIRRLSGVVKIYGRRYHHVRLNNRYAKLGSRYKSLTRAESESSYEKSNNDESRILWNRAFRIKKNVERAFASKQSVRT